MVELVSRYCRLLNRRTIFGPTGVIDVADSDGRRTLHNYSSCFLYFTEYCRYNHSISKGVHGFILDGLASVSSLLPLRLPLILNSQPYQASHPVPHINCHKQWNQEKRYIAR
jgi:hypothetical protein